MATVKELSEKLGVSQAKVYKMIKAGKIEKISRGNYREVEPELEFEPIEQLKEEKDEQLKEEKDEQPEEVKDEQPEEVKDEQPEEVKDEQLKEVKDEQLNEVKDEQPEEVELLNGIDEEQPEEIEIEKLGLTQAQGTLVNQVITIAEELVHLREFLVKNWQVLGYPSAKYGKLATIVDVNGHAQELLNRFSAISDGYLLSGTFAGMKNELENTLKNMPEEVTLEATTGKVQGTLQITATNELDLGVLLYMFGATPNQWEFSSIAETVNPHKMTLVIVPAGNQLSISDFEDASFVVRPASNIQKAYETYNKFPVVALGDKLDVKPILAYVHSVTPKLREPEQEISKQECLDLMAHGLLLKILGETESNVTPILYYIDKQLAEYFEKVGA